MNFFRKIHQKNSWERQESNLGLLDEKCKHYLCAMQPKTTAFSLTGGTSTTSPCCSSDTWSTLGASPRPSGCFPGSCRRCPSCARWPRSWRTRRSRSGRRRRWSSIWTSSWRTLDQQRLVANFGSSRGAVPQSVERPPKWTGSGQLYWHLWPQQCHLLNVEISALFGY